MAARRPQIESDVQNDTEASIGADPAGSGAVRRPLIEAGRVIASKFRLTRQLGQGGMGTVWAAVHETLGREVAVKFLHPQTNQNNSLTERFVSEARMVASIKHRFVVDVFDFGVTEDGLQYMVLELLQGLSLADRMDHGPAFQVRQAVQLMADCLRGLHVVHEAGIVHRDLKPDNIFVIEDADGAFPKLIDFGISKRTEAAGALGTLGAPGTPAGRRSRLTQPGTVIGTPYYMSPEQLRGRPNIDRRSDVYSVGVILFELVCGRLPFEQDNVGDLMVAITVQGAPWLASVRPELGAELATVVARALSANADDRHATALELREALLSILPTLPEHALSSIQSQQQPSPLGQYTNLQLQAAKSPFAQSLPAPIRRVQRPAKAWLLLGAAVLVLSLLMFWALKPIQSAPTVTPLQATAGPERMQQLAEPSIPKSESMLPRTAAAPLGTANRVGDDALPAGNIPRGVAAPAAYERPVVSAPEISIKSTRSSVHGVRTATSAGRTHGSAKPNRLDQSQKLYRKLDF
jgi:serine/threonine protein kinase